MVNISSLLNRQTHNYDIDLDLKSDAITVTRAMTNNMSVASTTCNLKRDQIQGLQRIK